MATHNSGGYNQTRRALVNNIRADTTQWVYDANNADADTPIYVNSTKASMRVRGITGRVGVAGTDAGAVTAALVKCKSGVALGSGTAIHTGTFDLKGTADTNQSLTLSTTKGALIIPPGASILIDLTGTPTSATGLISVDLVPA